MTVIKGPSSHISVNDLPPQIQLNVSKDFLTTKIWVGSLLNICDHVAEFFLHIFLQTKMKQNLETQYIYGEQSWPRSSRLN